MSYREQSRDDPYEDDANYYTPSGIPLEQLVLVTHIPYLDGGDVAVNWNPETNQFLMCQPGSEDWAVDRTADTLRAFATILAFNPKEWGCSRCGCSAEFKDNERICWCDTCHHGCDAPSMLESLAPASQRTKSPFFKRTLLPRPSSVLERLTAIGCDTDSFFEPKPVTPPRKSTVIMEDDERDEWFRNAEDRHRMFRGAKPIHPKYKK